MRHDWRQRLSSFRRRHLFNVYLLVGSVSIVVAVTLFTLNVSNSVEKQTELTTRLLSDLASRLITATRAIFEPRRCLIRLYQARIFASRRNTCSTSWPKMKRAILLPCLVIEPRRSVFSPEFRQPGVRPQ